MTQECNKGKITASSDAKNPYYLKFQEAKYFMKGCPKIAHCIIDKDSLEDPKLELNDCKVHEYIF